MTQALSAARMIRTTNGTIAFANLAAQIDGLELHAVQGWLTSRSWAELVDLLIMRADVLGRIADYERALALAELRARSLRRRPLISVAGSGAAACIYSRKR